MKTDVILIDNQGNGFENALAETRKAAVYRTLDKKDSLQLEMITEEMLSLARSVTGEMEASFWLESADRRFELHLTTKTAMDKEKRSLLIASATSRKNEAAKSLLGRLRDTFEQAMAAEVVHEYEEPPAELFGDLSYRSLDDPEWDGYERSILKKIADDIRISVRGGLVEMVVSKQFA